MLQMFDKNGQFAMPSQEALDALDQDTRQRFEVVRSASDDLKACEARLSEATDKVQAGIERINRANALLGKFRAPTFNDLHRASTTFAADAVRLGLRK
jgi:hypothetical protein